jgi:FkbM family methyltransferase
MNSNIGLKLRTDWSHPTTEGRELALKHRLARLKPLAVAALRPIPLRGLSLVEEVVAESQGKGWGAATAPLEARAIARLLDRCGVSVPVILDVGANRGDWSASVLKECPLAHIYAFEPSPAGFEQLSNRFQSDRRVTPCNLALGSQSTQAELWTNAPGSGLASFYRRDLRHVQEELALVESVQITTLRKWIDDLQLPHPNVLKLDVEGYEMQVLSGADGLIDSLSIVQFEFGGADIDARLFWRDFFYWFTDRGFDLWRLTPRGLSRIPRYRESDETFRTTNFFATRSTGELLPPRIAL